MLAEDKGNVSHAVILELVEGVTVNVRAKVFVLAAGAVHTPQIMFNSGIRPRALGHYLCDHPMGNCQVILSPTILHCMKEQYPEVVAQHARDHPDDPVPIPLNDPPPQVCVCLYVCCVCECVRMYMYTYVYAIILVQPARSFPTTLPAPLG